MIGKTPTFIVYYTFKVGRTGSIPVLGQKINKMNSRAYKKFKTEVGQANHFLITIIIGLDAVEDGAQKRKTFNTTWNPRNVEASVGRSRHYAIKSALAWVVDNLDMYLRICNREPRLYNDSESSEIADTKHSVYNKLTCVINNHRELSINKYAYVDLLVCWRNNLVHFDAENQLMPTSLNYFKNIPSDDIVTNTYHLDVDKMLNRFNNKECPTFKETATLISMTIHFVEELDRLLLRDIQQYRFLEVFLYQLLQQGANKTNVFDHTNTTSGKRKKRLLQLFATNGISRDFYNDDGEKFLQDVSELEEDEFKTRVRKKYFAI